MDQTFIQLFVLCCVFCLWHYSLNFELRCCCSQQTYPPFCFSVTVFQGTCQSFLLSTFCTNISSLCTQRLSSFCTVWDFLTYSLPIRMQYIINEVIGRLTPFLGARKILGIFTDRTIFRLICLSLILTNKHCLLFSGSSNGLETNLF